MFDDSSVPSNAATSPVNLPVGEPEDMFVEGEAAETTPRAPSALSSGLLRPKVATSVTSPTPVSVPSSPEPMSSAPAYQTPPHPLPAPDPGNDTYKMKEPILSRVLITIFLVLIAGGAVIAAGWWAYQRFFSSPTPPVVGSMHTPSAAPQGNLTVALPSTVSTTTTISPPPPVPPEVLARVSSTVQQPVSSSAAVDAAVLFGATDTPKQVPVVASDSPTMDDLRSRDTDGDGLSDYDEIYVWHTDPLKSDTDGDGYNDGVEIKNGYNPLGSGRLFRSATGTPATTTQ